MSDATYIYGSTEYIMAQIEVTAPGTAFSPGSWTAKMLLVDDSSSVVVSEVADINWLIATIETVGSEYYVKALLGQDVTLGVGTYRIYVKMVPNSGSETPIVRAEGTITIVGE